MAKKEIVKVGGGVLAARPQFLQDAPVVGMEEARQYIVHPRMKVVQKSSGKDLLDQFKVGSFILTPELSLLAGVPDGKGVERGDPLYFTPLYFFVEWATWNPISLRNTEPAIAYRTRDPRDPIVAKSRSRQLRMEPLRDPTGAPRMNGQQQLSARHVEHLNWVCVAHGVEGLSPTEPFVIGFSRGEHWSGQLFAGLVRKRNASPFACIFEARPTYRPGTGQGDWWGIEVSNPAEDAPVAPWVDEKMFAVYEKAYQDLREADRDRSIRADLDADTDIPEAEVVPSAGQRTM